MKGHAGAYRAADAANVPSVLPLQTLWVCVSPVEYLHGNMCAYPCAHLVSYATIRS